MALKKAHDELEELVKERTVELVTTNEKLKHSEENYRTFIDSTLDLVFLKDEHFRHMIVNNANSKYLGKKEHEIIGKTDFELLPKHMAEACRQSDLNALKSKSLEETNIALKVLLKKRDEDKEELQDNVMSNVKELISPFFKKIKKTKMNDQQRLLLGIIESNLNEIISPFTRKMSLKYLNLTPTEIRIAKLIKFGSPSKEIAELMNVSPRTVATHRKNIRRKIGLEGKRCRNRKILAVVFCAELTMNFH
jgi:PAS domain S-box-containing protein